MHMTLAPPHPDVTVEFDGGSGRTLAVIPLTSGNGYRVPVRLFTGDGVEEPDPTATVTLLYVGDEKPQLLVHPFDWTAAVGPSAPLACELRVSDTLPPARGVPGRRPAGSSEFDRDPHSDFGATPMVVIAVSYDPVDDVVQVVTRDGAGQLRRYRRPPEDTLDMSRPYDGRRRPRTVQRARQPETFVGPFVSVTGAQWVFQERSKRGGRLPHGTPRFDPDRPPQFDERTGDLVPYVAVVGKRDEVVGTWRSPHTFSETARKMPEVQQILRAAGLMEQQGDFT